MDFAVVHEEVNGVIPADLCSQVSEKRLELFLGEWEISDLYIQESMAFADSSTNGLAWLFTCTIFNGDIGSLVGPGILLIASCLENAFVDEYEMSVILLDLFDLIP